MFNSIGVIGLLALAGVLLTTATAPANAWHNAPVTDYAQARFQPPPVPACQPGRQAHCNAPR